MGKTMRWQNAMGDKHWWGIYDSDKGWMDDVKSGGVRQAIAAYRRKHPGAPKYGLSAGSPQEHSDEPVIGRVQGSKFDFFNPGGYRMARTVRLAGIPTIRRRDIR